MKSYGFLLPKVEAANRSVEEIVPFGLFLPFLSLKVVLPCASRLMDEVLVGPPPPLVVLARVDVVFMRGKPLVSLC